MEPFKELGARLRNWNRWGDDDARGTLNFITPARIVNAATLVRRGAVFDLGLEFKFDGPQTGALPKRINPVHLLSQSPSDYRTMTAGIGAADDFIFMPLQAATHWDGLGHYYYDGLLFNGRSTDSITTLRGSTQLPITALHRDVIGRGVLLDIARLDGVGCLAPDRLITPADLDAAADRQAVEIRSGDILLIRTGWMKHLASGSADDYLAREPGIGLACCEWLYDHEVAALASDNWAVEVRPSPEDDSVPGPVHPVLLRDMGLTLGEMFALDDLAADCAEDGVWEFLFSAPALKISGAVSAPLNPLAVK